MNINIKLIDDYIKNNKITKTQFCKLCNISTRALRKIYKGDFNFDSVVLFKIARVLKIKVRQLFCD